MLLYSHDFEQRAADWFEYHITGSDETYTLTETADDATFVQQSTKFFVLP